MSVDSIIRQQMKNNTVNTVNIADTGNEAAVKSAAKDISQNVVNTVNPAQSASTAGTATKQNVQKFPFQGTVKSTDAAIMDKDAQERMKTYDAIYQYAESVGDENLKKSMHNNAERERSVYGYSGGADGSGYITKGYKPILSARDEATLSPEDKQAVGFYSQMYQQAMADGNKALADEYHRKAEAVRYKYNYSGGADGSMPETIAFSHVDADKYKSIYDDMRYEQETHARKSIDYATDRAIEELRRAQDDAAATYDIQRARNEIDAKRAQDDAALRSQMLGDRGGIGQSQQTYIQSTAAQNKQIINSEQTRLATDTARQISDLRAEGEFEKADKLFEISQSYLQNLTNLMQYVDSYNLNVDQLNASLEQTRKEWTHMLEREGISDERYYEERDYNRNYQTSRDAVTDYWQQRTFDENVRQFNVGASQYDKSNALEFISAALIAGVPVSDEMYIMAGFDPNAVRDAGNGIASAYAAAAKSSGSSKGGDGSKSVNSGLDEVDIAVLQTKLDRGDNLTDAQLEKLLRAGYNTYENEDGDMVIRKVSEVNAEKEQNQKNEISNNTREVIRRLDSAAFIDERMQILKAYAHMLDAKTYQMLYDEYIN